MVSAACLAGWQTIVVHVCFFPENCGFAGKEKRQMDGKLKTQLVAFLCRYTPHVLSVKFFCPVPNIAIEAGMFFLNFITHRMAMQRLQFPDMLA